MKYIGGKRNVFCELQKISLMNATEKESSYKYGRIEFYWCCNFECKLCIWKSYIDRLDPDVINFIDNNENSNRLDPKENDKFFDNDELILPYDNDKSAGGSDDDSDDFIFQDNDKNDFLKADDFEYFLT